MDEIIHKFQNKGKNENVLNKILNKLTYLIVYLDFNIFRNPGLTCTSAQDTAVVYICIVCVSSKAFLKLKKN